MTNFNITIVSDPICPFCYLGKKRLERAIHYYKKTIPGGSADTFTVTWKPYYLDPTLPQGKGTPVLERMASKFGPDRIEALTQRLTLMGRSEGICFSFQGKLGNTRDAHRLVQLARQKDAEKGGDEVQERLMSALMSGYFEEGGDITSHEMLLDAAAKAEMDRAEAKKWLEEGGGGEEVDREVEGAYAKGIRGVPHFFINDRFEISGAQDVEEFLGEFVKAKEAEGGIVA
ncbi:DSBA oxidoreductase [Cryphonectria parasitica EP155]|uniref:DSBA oxidoreductase n=1 Tax=Cryphonectria parasitica (strain ATCC 38755 / EP155) TaxID=660469 RepID=A0A9P4XY50_CRYP1|nr:DSBA oxidoreductase [Cryphonectria parasitica EP155]KAF3763031.1 DSBA oxidoreductase [Cryphonectria parasitica EP155]